VKKAIGSDLIICHELAFMRAIGDDSIK